MKLLLDTHILLWWLANDPALKPRARQLIADPDNAIFLSSVTLWEIWLKHSIGKLTLPADFEARLAKETFESLPLAATHTKAVASLPWIHRDPFDRMLVAQAILANLKLLTVDDTIAAYGNMTLLVN